MNSEDLTEDDWLYFYMTAPKLMRWLEASRGRAEFVSWHLNSSLCEVYLSDEYLVVNGVRYMMVVHMRRGGDLTVGKYVVSVDNTMIRIYFMGVI